MSLRNEIELFTKLSGEDGLHTSIGRIGGYLDGYEKGKSETKWIPVSERLPDEGCDVLITKEPFKIKGYKQEVIKAKRAVDPRSGKIKWWSEFGTLTNKAVFAWMPLPAPYRKEGEEV